MSAAERRATLALAGVFVLRMLGLFLILPVLALHAATYAGATPVLLGVALGVYGLTQALFQIPLGLLSDRIGRVPVIVGGLALFAAGSVVAAFATQIEVLILGRALQGAGAIAAAVVALVADLTRDSQRTKAMALIGMSIGASFLVAVALGPVLDRWFGIAGIFLTTAILAVAAIAVTVRAVPRPARESVHAEAETVPVLLADVLRDRQLIGLDMGVFVLHAVLMAGFTVIPVALRDGAGLASAHHGTLWLGVLLVSILSILPFLRASTRSDRVRPLFVGAIAVLCGAELLLLLMHRSLPGMVIALVVFFAAFNLLEASLPSLVSRLAAARSRGTALGVFSTAQFLGIFTGGAMGGWLSGRFGMEAVFVMNLALTLGWLIQAVSMPFPARGQVIETA